MSFFRNAIDFTGVFSTYKLNVDPSIVFVVQQLLLCKSSARIICQTIYIFNFFQIESFFEKSKSNSKFYWNLAWEYKGIKSGITTWLAFNSPWLPRFDSQRGTKFQCRLIGGKGAGGLIIWVISGKKLEVNGQEILQ